jgi:hypothetical protein
MRVSTGNATPVPADALDSGEPARTPSSNSRPPSPVNKGALGQLDPYGGTSRKIEGSPAIQTFQRTLAENLDNKLIARFDKKINTATSFDDFANLFDASGIARLKPNLQEKLFPRATLGLVNKLNTDLATTPGAAGILRHSVTGLARVTQDDFRAAGIQVAGSKLPVVPRNEQQSVFDHILETTRPLSSNTRSQALKSLAPNIFKSLAPGQADRGIESINLGRQNLKQVLTGVARLDDAQQKVPVLCNLAGVAQLFALDDGDWRSPFNDLVQAMRGLPQESQPAVRQSIDRSLTELEKAGVSGVSDARETWGLSEPSA